MGHLHVPSSRLLIPSSHSERLVLTPRGSLSRERGQLDSAELSPLEHSVPSGLLS